MRPFLGVRGLLLRRGLLGWKRCFKRGMVYAYGRFLVPFLPSEMGAFAREEAGTRAVVPYPSPSSRTPGATSGSVRRDHRNNATVRMMRVTVTVSIMAGIKHRVCQSVKMCYFKRLIFCCMRNMCAMCCKLHKLDAPFCTNCARCMKIWGGECTKKTASCEAVFL